MSGMVTEPMCIDPTVLGTLRAELGEDADTIIADMIDSFPAETQTQLARIIPGAPAGELAKAAHRLRGSALNLGATALCDVCARTELAANNGDAAGALANREDIVRELTRVVEALPSLRSAG
ncbi:MAG TPA: hypothetical protein DCS97_05485 [Planctomycetes bacterium]|nr:hypothetical protein [Planctomycetota bacterium]